MNKSFDTPIYKGMTASQIAELYDDTITIPNFYTLLQENRELAKNIKDKLTPIHDVPYGNEEIQKLDLYVPKHAKNLPVLIDIHGGGWTAGSKEVRSIPAEAIMSQGIIWAPIDYGLAPKYRMENMINHVRTSLAWVYHNISQYGGDPTQIFISGQSAGAHLAATALIPGWHNSFDVPEKLIKGLIALSGIYDLGSLVQPIKTETQESLKLTTDEAMLFSPLYHLPKNAITILIAYGNNEPFAYMQEAKDYAKELGSAGCKVSSIIVPDANHFDMINVIGKSDSLLFKTVMEIIFKNY